MVLDPEVDHQACAEEAEGEHGAEPDGWVELSGSAAAVRSVRYEIKKHTEAVTADQGTIVLK